MDSQTSQTPPTLADVTKAAAHMERKRIRVNGQQTLADVARVVCHDVRLVTLLQDLNPGLPATGALPAGTVVVCPAKLEAQAFAKKMGISLGFDPCASNGSDARRKWAAHVGTSATSSSSPSTTSGRKADPLQLATTLLARGVTAAEVGRRLAKLCDAAELVALQQAGDAAVRQAGLHGELHALFPKALSRIAAVRSVLDATLRPGGLLAVLQALATSPVDAVAVLQAAAVAPALRSALVEDAPRVVAVVNKAREIAQLERGARDATIQADALAVMLRPLVDAFVDGVDVLGGARAAAVGVEAEADALSRHLDMLRGALKQAEDGLGRAAPDVIRALAHGRDGARLPRPWPLLAGVCKDVGAAVDAAPATARDGGLGGLVRRRSAAGSAKVSLVTVAELHHRAAATARAQDEGDAFVERLAPVVVELFGLMRPPPAVDGGTPQARKARRRMAFEHAAAGKGGVSAEGVAAVVADVLERARLAGNAAAGRLTRSQLSAIDEAARQMTGSITIHRHPMSELGRALVVAAMALDREVGQGLSRPTGREAFVAAAVRHAGRVLSGAACRVGG